jgi:hypothetical protein
VDWGPTWTPIERQAPRRITMMSVVALGRSSKSFPTHSSKYWGASSNFRLIRVTIETEPVGRPPGFPLILGLKVPSPACSTDKETNKSWSVRVLKNATSRELVITLRSGVRIPSPQPIFICSLAGRMAEIADRSRPARGPKGPPLRAGSGSPPCAKAHSFSLHENDLLQKLASLVAKVVNYPETTA